MKHRHNFFSFLSKNRWYIIGVFWAAGLALAYAGFTALAAREGIVYTWLDKIYLTLQLIFLESGATPQPPLALNIARFLLPFLTAQTSLMALAGIFQRELRRRTLRFARGHIIVCGDGGLAFFAARAVLKSGQRVALVTRDAGESGALAVQDAGAVVLSGDLQDPEVAEQAALHRAGTLLSFYDDDNKNIENALLADAAAAGRSKGALQCITHLHDPLISNLFLEQTLKAMWKPSVQHDVINIYEQAARLTLQNHPAGVAAASVEDAPILILGFGKFGQHILLEKARRLAALPGGAVLNVHILDREADWKCTALHKRHPDLARFCCITPHQLDIYSPEFQDTARFLEERCPGVSAVYVCLNDDLQAINTALTIYRQLEGRSPHIILRLLQAGGVKNLFSYAGKIEKIQLVPFFDEIGTPDVLLNSTVELLAQAFHERYVQERLTAGAVGPALVHWLDLAEDKKESNRRLARHLKKHLELLHYQLAPQPGLTTPQFTLSPVEIDFLAQKEHERWMAEMQAGGWRYGPRNDPRKKTNPDLLPWERLTTEEKKFNRDLMRSAPELVHGARLQIVSRPQARLVVPREVVRVGISGHRFLHEPAELQKQVCTALEKIAERHKDLPLRLYTPLATGADQLAGQAALEQGIPYAVVIPYKQDRYLQTLSAEDQENFHKIAEKAAEVICLDATEDGNEAFQALASFLVQNMDYLIAVWNGRPERGPGGTGEVARNFRETGKPMVWIRADNMAPGEPVPLPPTLRQGSVVYENW